MIDIIVDTHIKFNPNDIPEYVLENILNKLRFSNPYKKNAEREKLWNAKKLPDYIDLWKYENNSIILPRGFLNYLNIILSKNNIFPIIKDETESDDKYFDEIPEISLRNYQVLAATRLIENEYGIYKSPTGSGKTRTMLELARQCNQKTLIICEKNDIKSQWEETAEILGFHRDDMCIILRQTLWTKINDIDENWFAHWGTVIVDECHHAASADTLIDLIQKFPARYRFGCSATPDADPDLFPIAQAVLGPIVAETSPEEIGEHLVIPSVRVVKTDFEFPYRPTFVEKGGKIIRNNYNSMMSDLESDNNRNELIMNFALKDSMNGHNCLVISKRKKHLRYLENALYDILKNKIGPRVFSLTGDNSNESTDIASNIEYGQGGSILFSTLADEGTNIPILDRLFLAYPGRKLRGFEQSIGRIMRPHYKKKDAIVYDFRDVNVSILNSQFRNRCQNIFHKKGYKVENVN